MSISCEIKTFKHADGVFKPGDVVSGVVYYKVSEETVFSKITLSLKGMGKLYYDITYISSGHYAYSYLTKGFDGKETYVDIDNIVLDNSKGIVTAAGTHEVPFTFKLPEKIPPSIKVKTFVDANRAKCKIYYYIRIKFEKPGFSNSKKFKAEIMVANVATPTPSKQAVFTSVKKPFQLLEAKDKVITINGTLDNTVVTPNGHVKVGYTIVNASNLDIKKVKVFLCQETKFYPRNVLQQPKESAVDEYLTKYVATPVKAGETQSTDLIVDIPAQVSPVEYSKLVSRNYFISIIADLPNPHTTAVLKMPIKIMESILESASEKVDDESPPSYYEAMKEYEKSELD